MPNFVVVSIDKPNALDLRLATREAHLAWAHTRAEVRFGGPFLNDKGEMIGSLSILEADNREQVEDMMANDPYVKAGLFESVQIRAWRCTVGAEAFQVAQPG